MLLEISGYSALLWLKAASWQLKS